MARRPSELLPPSSLEDALTQLAFLSEEKFSRFQAAVESNEAFDTDKERMARLAPEMGLSPEALFYAVSASSFLYNRINKEAPSGIDVQAVLRTFVESFDEALIEGVDKNLLVSRLIILMSPKQNVEELRKITRIRKGFIPNARSFQTLLDLRPNFTDGYEEVSALIPVFQFRITTDSDDAAKKEIVFQVDERRLKKIKESIESAEKKLATLSASGSLKPLLYLREDRDDNEQ